MLRPRVYEERFREPLFCGPSYATKCLDCGKVVTRYDHTPEESLLFSLDHDCGNGD